MRACGTGSYYFLTGSYYFLTGDHSLTSSLTTIMNKFFAGLFGGTHTKPPVTPRILISISTSSPILSKSHPSEFAITLEAGVDAPKPITIDIWRAVLDSGHLALDYEGLTFKDCARGEFAPRIVIDVFSIPPSVLAVDSKYIVEIPPTTGEKAYIVVHKFNGRKWSEEVQIDDEMMRKLEETAEELRRLEEISGMRRRLSSENDRSERRYPDSDVDGFEVGHIYEVGLGTKMASVGSWKWGSKEEVFAEEERQRREEWRHGERVEMILERTARFEVVE
ncbi:hypothetical protein CKM354_001284700 [Cercospora kikuchii]|uniref:Uncharacterized protein n=1 Tax=Cercospora kikuchii TaxID=84275 RepID=A0A9P3FMS1_9PEZI|nr:uncharacterized protein CKM354_001284700 [Cercospora kikuchii]GIZ49823.1 hypothetical protein CKM354_001284700 [Cercospora kikuchii]